MTTDWTSLRTDLLGSIEAAAGLDAVEAVRACARQAGSNT